jgi:hypothetical protein
LYFLARIVPDAWRAVLPTETMSDTFTIRVYPRNESVHPTS